MHFSIIKKLAFFQAISLSIKHFKNNFELKTLRMENLIKRKQKLEQELVLYQEKYQKLESEEKDNVSKSTKLIEELNNERLNFEQLKATRKNYKNNFLHLKKEISLYKENKIAEVRKFYVKKYNGLLKRIAQLDFRLSYKIFGTFENAREIYDEIEFENLKNDFYKFTDTKRNDLKQKTLDSLRIKLYDRKKIHEALFYLRFLVKYELFFKENLMIDFFYGITQNEFEYHFLSNKETNRLDKPEWIFEFLIEQFTKYSKIFRSYEEIFVVERMAHNMTLIETTSRPLFEQYITKSTTLISLKINEIANFESKQKRKLILNFGIHLVKFIQKVEKDFSFFLKIDEFSQVIDEIQSNYFYERLEDVHNRRYVEWFEIYEDITREVMVYVCNFRSLNINFKLIDLIDNILEYNSVFVCSMRYIQREEIRALCYLYNKFEKFKGFLIDTENELIQEKVTRNEEKDNLIVLDDEEMINILNKITEFNLENLKLMKSLIENDLQNLLSTLKRFRYSSDTISRNFMIETSRIFEDYKECDAYRILHKLASSLTDKFLLEEILISQKFNINEFLDFNYFFSKLKRFYDIDAWESQEALNCIKDILEDRKRQGPLFEIINELYNDDKNF